MFLSLRIALRYLFSRKSHSAVNIISFISLAGVAVATLAIVCVLSVFNGFRELAESRLSVMDPVLQVTTAEDSGMILNADSLASEIEQRQDIEMALPTLTGQALVKYHDNQMPVRLKGVPDGYEKLTRLSSVIIDGTYITPSENATAEYQAGVHRSYACLSIGVAAGLSSRSGFYDLMEVYVPRRTARINPANPLGAVVADSVVISSVFEVDQPEYDADIVILPLEDVRTLLEYDTEASAIEIQTAAGADIESVKLDLQQMLGDNYIVKNRVEQQQQAFRMISVEKWITFLLLAFILIIASFNIISTLSILIIDKEDNIRTMTALGAPRRLITRIFMLEGWLVSFGGGVVGILLGVALCLAQQTWGIIRLAGNSAALSITAYPVKVEPFDLLIVLALVALIGLVTTLVTRRFIRTR